jgi:hypothetical protein
MLECVRSAAASECRMNWTQTSLGTDDSFHFERKQANDEQEAALDGIRADA